MKTFFTLIFLIIVFLAPAQNTFRTRIFLPGSDYLYQIVQLDDGSFVSLTFNYSSISNIRLVKTDAAGAVIAFKELTTTTPYSTGSSIVKTSDGGFTVAGGLNSQTVLLKFKADLSIAWQREYDATGGTLNAVQLIQTKDGGYILAGSIMDNNFKYAASLIKTDSLGVIQFQKRYSDYNGSIIFQVTPMKDGDYAILIYSSTANANYIGNLHPNGTLVWAKELDDNNNYPASIHTITGTSDGNLVISGISTNKMIIAKVNNNGSLIWSKTLQNPNTGSGPGGMLEDKDGGYLFAGSGYVITTGVSYGYVVNTDSSGVLRWTKTFEPGKFTSIAFGYCIATSDGGYAACGPGGFLGEDSNYHNYGFIYKFNSSFETCGDSTGSTSDSLANFGAIHSVQLSPADINLTVTNPNVTISDAASTTDNLCSGDALPVQLLSFNAVLKGKSVGISWTTANEINSNYFLVERSANGTSFNVLQRVDAKGNSSTMQSYKINDLKPLPGTSYYRLKEMDKDGKVTYSSIVPVTVMGNGTIVISPNPVQNDIRVIVQNTINSNLTLEVMDINGNVLAVQTKSVGAGRNEIIIAATTLARGVYVLKVIDNENMQTIKFVKE